MLSISHKGEVITKLVLCAFLLVCWTIILSGQYSIGLIEKKHILQTNGLANSQLATLSFFRYTEDINFQEDALNLGDTQVSWLVGTSDPADEISHAEFDISKVEEIYHSPMLARLFLPLSFGAFESILS